MQLWGMQHVGLKTAYVHISCALFVTRLVKIATTGEICTTTLCKEMSGVYMKICCKGLTARVAVVVVVFAPAIPSQVSRLCFPDSEKKLMEA